MAQGREEVLWTPANKVTLLRICLIPLFVVVILSPWPEWLQFWGDAEEWKPWIAAAVFIAISCTDAVDGYLARSRNEVTTLGKFMDPLADKILVAAALLALIELGKLPSWVALVILAREFIVSGIRMIAATEGLVIAASWYGKAKTVAQIVAIVLFIVKDSHMIGAFSEAATDGLYLFSWAVMAVALVLTVVSMLDYFAKASSLLGFGGEADPSGTGADAALGLEAKAGEVLAQAREAGLSLGTAESCTGGLIAATLTAVPGSSDVFLGGIVSYANAVKEGSLGVRPETLAEYGAVSEQTACQMAEGARRALGVDVAISVTGIAGPGGAVPGKPVGTVWVGASSATGTSAELFHFAGDRAAVREQTVHAALDALSRAVGALKSR